MMLGTKPIYAGKLRHKILLPLLAVSISAWIVLSLWEWLSSRNSHLDTLKTYASTLARAMALASENVTDINSIQRMLTATSAEEHVIDAFIFEPASRNVIASSQQRLIGRDITETLAAEPLFSLLRSIQPLYSERQRISSEGELWLIIPLDLSLRRINLSAKKEFALLLRMDAKPALQAAKMRALRTSVSLVFIFVSIAALVFFLLQRMVIQPVEEIAYYLKHKALSEQHVLAPIRSFDEIGSLAESFNSLLEEVRRSAAAQKVAQEHLVHSAKMSSLGEMAGGIAHEINNPLAIICGKVSRLKKMSLAEKLDPERLLNDLETIDATAQRIVKIIRGLRTFSRDSEQDPMTLMNVGRIVEDTLELCGERFKNHAIDLRIVNSSDLWISCRPTEISQILMNLLSNSFDAVEDLPEKWVVVEVIKAGERLMISVKDSGRGIPHEVAQRMMQPFFTTKSPGKGTGIGLSISSGIAEAHGGKIYYDANSAHTCFIVELPLQSQSNAA